MLTVLKIVIVSALGAVSSIVIMEGLNAGSWYTPPLILAMVALFAGYTFAGKIELLDASLAAELSKKPFFTWASITIVSTLFLVILGVTTAYLLDVVLNWNSATAATIGVLIALLVALVFFFSQNLGMSLLATPVITTKVPSKTQSGFMEVLESDIKQLKSQGAFLLILCGSIGAYAGYQASQAIGIIDSRGVSTEFINIIRERISAREQLLFDALQGTDFAVESDRTRYEKRKEQIDLLLVSDRLEYESELERVRVLSQDVTGRFVFSFFSSFFVRVGSVLISLGFFTIVFHQYRRVDRQRAELSQLRLAHLSIQAGNKSVDISNARKALAIRDFVPTRRETDSYGSFAAATIGGVPDIINQSGIQLPRPVGEERTNSSAEKGDNSSE